MRIYFAHPAFTEQQKTTKNRVLDAFSIITTKVGFDKFTVLDPFEFSPNIEGDRAAKGQMSGVVLHCNERLMDSADVCVAIIDDKDVGTIYEMGYMRAQGKMLITISNFDYDVNIMLHKSVAGHFPNFSTDQTFINFVNSLSSIAQTHHSL